MNRMFCRDKNKLTFFEHPQPGGPASLLKHPTVTGCVLGTTEMNYKCEIFLYSKKPDNNLRSR